MLLHRQTGFNTLYYGALLPLIIPRKKPHSSPKRKVGFQKLQAITFLPGKVIGERISGGIITEWEGMSTGKK